MKRYSILFLTLFLVVINSFGENLQQSNFKIDGTVNADSGTIYLKFYSDYMPNGTKELVAEVQNQKFSIAGYIPESQAVVIALDNRYVSSDFIIEKGLQSVSLNIDSIREVPLVHNKTMLEEYRNYEAFRKDIKVRNELFNQKRDSLQKIYHPTFSSKTNLH